MKNEQKMDAGVVQKQSNEQTKAEELEILRQEILGMQRKEMGMKSRGEKYNPHFDGFVPENLTLEELEIYKEVKDRSLTEEKLLKFKAGLPEMPISEMMKNNRHTFSAWITNLVESEENLEWWDPEMYRYFLKAKEEKKN